MPISTSIATLMGAERRIQLARIFALKEPGKSTLGWKKPKPNKAKSWYPSAVLADQQNGNSRLLAIKGAACPNIQGPKTAPYPGEKEAIAPLCIPILGMRHEMNRAAIRLLGHIWVGIQEDLLNASDRPSLVHPD